MSPMEALPMLRSELQRFDPDFTIYSVATLQERLAGEAAGTRSFTTLMAIFGSIAVGLALIGTYGVIAFSIAQRTREIGIRMALGARRGDIVKLVTLQGLRIAVAGLALGLAAALVLTRFLATFLFKVESRDPLVFAAIAAVVGLAAVAASYVP